MKTLMFVLALFAATFATGTVQAGIFGRRGRPATSGYRSYAQPTTNPFPFNSRSDPRDWQEAHRGYGIKIRGW